MDSDDGGEDLSSADVDAEDDEWHGFESEAEEHASSNADSNVPPNGSLDPPTTSEVATSGQSHSCSIGTCSISCKSSIEICPSTSQESYGWQQRAIV